MDAGTARLTALASPTSTPYGESSLSRVQDTYRRRIRRSAWDGLVVIFSFVNGLDGYIQFHQDQVCQQAVGNGWSSKQAFLCSIKLYSSLTSPNH
jgi:hypothetical protein